MYVLLYYRNEWKFLAHGGNSNGKGTWISFKRQLHHESYVSQTNILQLSADFAGTSTYSTLRNHNSHKKQSITAYLVDVHIEQQLLEVRALVHTSVVAAPDDGVLLQGHGVEGQQQQAARDGHRRGLVDREGGGRADKNGQSRNRGI
jgi:hypothetical protein